MNLVICDDHPVFADSLAQLLRARGFHIAGVAFHPHEAIRILAEQQVDVGVFDVTYGPSTITDHLIDVAAANAHAQLMILTAALAPEVVRGCIDGGVIGFAEKRQSTNEIISIIQHVAAGQRVIPPSIDLSRPPIAPSRTSAAYGLRRLAEYLTPREREVLSALVGGLDTTALARKLGIAPETARSHIQSTLVKLNVHSRLEAATLAVRSGILNPETGEWLG